MRAVNKRVKYLSLILLSLFFAASLAFGEEEKPRYAVSPLNMELGCRFLGYSPMIDPSLGISIELGFNPGWFINRQAALGLFFSYAHYFGANCSRGFLEAAAAAYAPIDYPYGDPQTSLDLLLAGELDDLSDHRWGMTFRLPIPYTPFLKAYWLSRAIVIKSGSGDTTVGGITYIGGSAGYSLLAQGAGAELSIPLATLRWPIQKWTDWFAVSRVSVFGQWIAFDRAVFSSPRPLVSEFFGPDFMKKYANQLEFGIMLSVGI